MTIIGHEKIRGQISSLLSKRQFPQTSLWYGQAGSGKKTVANGVIQKLLCEEELATACGVCRSCELFLAGNHPDFHLIEPTGSATSKSTSGRKTIKAEQIQQVREKLVFAPLVSSYQVVLIDDAEAMTTVTANSLLKILEEPKPNQIFILVTSQFHKILVTIRSRSSKFFFAPLSSEDVAKILRQRLGDESWYEKSELIQFYSRCFPGSPATVEKALELPLTKEDFDVMTHDQSSFAGVRDQIQSLLQKELDLKIFLQALRGACLLKIKDGEGISLDFVEKTGQALRQLDRHIQKEFVLENLFLN